MENLSVPDLAAAARHLESAKTSLLEVVRALRNDDRAQGLKEIGTRLGEMAGHFRDGMLTAGLKVDLVSKKAAAAAMGRVHSDLKLLKLADAREKLAAKRLLEKERKEIRKKVAGHTMKLHDLG